MTTASKLDPSRSCPCGSGNNFGHCCQLVLSERATTPEALMRSRFTAYCLAELQYLEDTLAPDKRSPDDRAAIAANAEENNWLSLKVIDTTPATAKFASAELSSGSFAWVEFVAFYRRRGASAPNDVQQLHEKSRFCFIDNRWFYLDGDYLPPIKLGRNDNCWCGSGTKLKKCHG